MRWVFILITVLLSSNGFASQGDEMVEEVIAVPHVVLEMDAQTELHPTLRQRTPEQLAKFKEAIEKQRNHVIDLSKAIDRGESALVADLINRQLWYRRGAAAAGFFGFTLDSISPVLVTISTAAGGPTYINYISGGMGAAGTFLLGLTVYLKSNCENIQKEIAAIHEKEQLELSRMESEYHALTKDLNIIATQEVVKNQFEIEKRSAIVQVEQAKHQAALAQAELLRQQRQLPVRKMARKRETKAPTKTETTPLMGEEKGKDEEEN